MTTFKCSEGNVTVTADGIELSHNMHTSLRNLRSHPAQSIPAAEVSSVAVGGNKKQYLTAARVAGAVACAGIALLAPTKVRGALVIGTTDGDVHSYTLGRRDAKHAETVAMAFAAAGYEVV